MSISGLKGLRFKWPALPEELKSLTIEKVDALEFDGNSFCKLPELTLKDVCVYAANEMMSVVSVETLNLSNCFLIVSPSKKNGVGLS